MASEHEDGDYSAAQAGRIVNEGKTLDYEQMALDAIERSWVLEDRECMALALADAQAWATLHLARVLSHPSPTDTQPAEGGVPLGPDSPGTHHAE